MAKWLVNLEMDQNQITEPVIHNLGSAPADGVGGQMYYNSGTNKMFYNDGGGGGLWVEFGTGSGSVSTVTAGVGTSDSGTASDPIIDLDYSGTELTAGTTFDVNDRIAIYDNTALGMRYLTHTQFITELEGDLSHNNLTDFVGNEHINHTSVTITAGSGLSYSTGGTDISASATIDLDINSLAVATPAAGDFIPFWDITATADNKKITYSNFEAGLTILESQITDGSILARVGGNETISGSWTFNNVLIASTAPTLDTHLANKAYVDSVAQGLDIKGSVKFASTADVPGTYTATGGSSARGQFTAMANTAIDGVTLVQGDRLLLKDQTGTGAENGIWIITTLGTGANGVWDRATDFDEDDEVTSGAFCFVEQGTANADTGWVLTTEDPITIGGASGTVLVWAQFSGAGSYTAGNGLDLGGTEFTLTVPTSNLSGASTNAVAAGGHTHAIDTGIANTNLVQAETGATNNYVTIWTATGITGEQYLATSRGGLGISLAAAANGTLLIGNGTGFDINTANSTDGTITLTTGSGTLDIEARAASTTQTGVAEAAIQSEVDIGTDTLRYVSPDTLRGTPDITRPGTNISTRKYAIACAAATSTTVTHNFGTRQVQVEVYETATPWETVYADVARTSTNVVTVTFAVAPAADAYTIVVIG